PVRPWQPGASTPTARAVMSGHLLFHSVGRLVVMEELVTELMEEVVEGNRWWGEVVVLMLGVLVAVDVIVVEMEVLVEEVVEELIEMVEEDVDVYLTGVCISAGVCSKGLCGVCIFRTSWLSSNSSWSASLMTPRRPVLILANSQPVMACPPGPAPTHTQQAVT
ncbi:unnamed protein product, partial [Arctogadus glacialis]